MISSVLQGGERLTLEQAVFGYQRKLVPQLPSQLGWISGTKTFGFVQDSLYLIQSNNGTIDTVLSTGNLSGLLADFGRKPLRRLPRLRWHNPLEVSFRLGDSLYVYHRGDNRLRLLHNLPDSTANLDLSEQQMKAAFTRGHSLFVQDHNGLRAVTNESSSEIVSGTTVSRNEFGIRKGTFWSPTEKYLAFYQKDESRVDNYPFVDFKSTPAEFKPAKYPMAGTASERVRIGIFNLENGKITWLQTDDPSDAEQYLTAVSWSPDEKYLYTAHINRGQNHLRLIRYDIRNGKRAGVLFEEKDEQYIDPQTGLFFPPEESGNFLWLS